MIKKIYQWENNYNSIREFIFQPITLDSELNPFEKVKKNGIHFKFPIKDSEVEETIEEFGDDLSRLISRFPDIKQLIKQALSDNQSKLNAIEEVVKNADKYLNHKRVGIITKEIKQIIGDE